MKTLSVCPDMGGWGGELCQPKGVASSASRRIAGFRNRRATLLGRSRPDRKAKEMALIRGDLLLASLAENPRRLPEPRPIGARRPCFEENAYRGYRV